MTRTEPQSTGDSIHIVWCNKSLKLFFCYLFVIRTSDWIAFCLGSAFVERVLRDDLHICILNNCSASPFVVVVCVDMCALALLEHCLDWSPIVFK